MTDLAPRTLLTSRDVARRLGRTANWFYRNRARLEKEHGFPASVGGCGGRWDPVAIAAWLDAQLPMHLRPPAVEAADPDAPPGGWAKWMVDQARKPHVGEAA